jgi:hypothetical protein
MGTLILVALGTVVAWTAIRLGRSRDEMRRKAWRDAAMEAGLESVVVRERFLGRELTGRAGPLTVKFARFHRGKHRSGTRIEIGGLGHEPFDLLLRREGFMARVDRALTGERDIETGDAAFDREVVIEGRPALALAVLGARARQAVLAMTRGRVPLNGGAAVEADFHIAYGKITAEIAESVFDDPDHPEVSGALLRWLLDAARVLSAPPSVPAALAANLAADPVAGVRLACLLQLLEAFADDPAARSALVTGQADQDPRVRVEAAVALAEEGLETLLDVVRTPETEDGLRARAVAALGARLPVEVAVELIARGEGGPHRASAIACIEALGKVGGPAKDVLAAALAAGERALAVAAARALGDVGPQAEDVLVLSLSDARPEVRVAAAVSLGHVGSVASVPALREAAQRSIEGGLGRAVRQAVASIQARLSSAEPGQLSLSGAEAGRLTLVEGQAGELSLAEDRESESHEPAGDDAEEDEPPLRLARGVSEKE